MFYGGREYNKMIFFFFSWTYIHSFRIQFLKKTNANIWQIKKLEFEIAQIHFLREVFVAIAVHVTY